MKQKTFQFDDTLATKFEVFCRARMLVEKRADAEELRQAKMSSWEHGHIRTGEGNGVIDIGPCLIARGEADAPDIDGRVLVRGDLPLGQFADVRITGHTDYDLIAEPA